MIALSKFSSQPQGPIFQRFRPRKGEQIHHNGNIYWKNFMQQYKAHINRTNFSSKYPPLFSASQTSHYPLHLPILPFEKELEINTSLRFSQTFCSSSALFLMSSSVNTFSMSPAIITRSLPKQFKMIKRTFRQ